MKEIIFGLGVLLFGVIAPEDLGGFAPETIAEKKSVKLLEPDSIEVAGETYELSHSQILESGLSLPDILTELYPDPRDTTSRSYVVDILPSKTIAGFEEEVLHIRRDHTVSMELFSDDIPFYEVNYILSSSKKSHAKSSKYFLAQVIYSPDLKPVFSLNDHIDIPDLNQKSTAVSKFKHLKLTYDNMYELHELVGDFIADMAPKVISGEGNF